MNRVSPKKFRAAFLAPLAVGALAACGGGAGAAPGATGDVVTIDPGAPVRIRTILSMTGSASLGEPLLNGVRLAAEDFRRVHGHPIDLGEPLDGKCSPEGGAEAARIAIADPQALGVVGTSCSAAAVAASPLISVGGLVMIAPSNTSPALTSDLMGNPSSDYYPGYFRVSNNDLHQGSAVASFAWSDLGLRRVATVDDGDPYTSALAGAFATEFRALGGEVPARAVVSKGDADMSGVLVQFAAAEPDGVFFPLFRAEASELARQAREFDGLESVALISGAAALVTDFLEEPHSVGVYFSGPETQFSGVNNYTGQSAESALARYEAAYGGRPASPYWAHAYDAAALLLAAIQRAGVRDDGNAFTRAIGIDDEGRLLVDRGAVRAAVADVSRDFEGLTGPVRCDVYGDCGSGRVIVYEHADPNVTNPADLRVAHRYEP